MCGDTFASVELGAGAMDAYKDVGDGVHMQICFQVWSV